MKRTIFLGGIFASIAVCMFFVSSVHAVSVSPLKQTLVVEKNKPTLVHITVENNTDTAKTFVPHVQNFVIDPDTGRAHYETTDEAINWVQPSAQTISLGVREQTQLAFSIEIPEEAERRSRYLALFVKEASAGGQIGVGAQVGSLLYLHMAGDVHEAISLSHFDTTKSIYARTPIDIELTLINDGTIHLIPEGHIRVQNMWGTEKGFFYVNPHKRIILPSADRDESFVLNKLSWRDTGRITLTAKTNYGASNKTAMHTISFWYIPLPIVLLMILLGIIFGGAWYQKHHTT